MRKPRNRPPLPTTILLSLCCAAGLTVAVAQEADKAGAAEHAAKAIAAMKDTNWQRARDEWQATVKCDPGNPAAHSNLGKVLYRLGSWEAAAASLEKAVAIKPTLADSWLTLGLSYQELQAPMRAVSCLTRAVHESPADPQTHNALGIVLKKIGWTSAAESELQKAIDLEPKFADAHFNLAAMYLERKPPSLEMARRHYGAALELGATPDEAMEAQLAGEGPVVDEAEPPAPETPAAPEPPDTSKEKKKATASGSSGKTKSRPASSRKKE